MYQSWSGLADEKESLKNLKSFTKIIWSKRAVAVKPFVKLTFISHFTETPYKTVCAIFLDRGTNYFTTEHSISRVWPSNNQTKKIMENLQKPENQNSGSTVAILKLKTLFSPSIGIIQV